MNVIRFVCHADGTPSEFDGKYLWKWNVDAGGYEAAIAVTPDPADAHHFSSASEALDVWRTQSTKVPLRPDGKPNRPLTAFTVEVLAVASNTSEEES